MLGRIVFATVVAICAALSPTGGAHAAGFTCPYKEVADAPKNLPPLKGLQEDMGQVEAQGLLFKFVGDLIAAKVPPAIIVDHLVWAYCPLVADDTKLSVAQKVERVRRFASQVAGLVYAGPGAGEIAILVDLPLAPDVLTRVDAAAGAVGMSRDDWMRQAIDKALGTP